MKFIWYYVLGDYFLGTFYMTIIMKIITNSQVILLNTLRIFTNIRLTQNKTKKITKRKQKKITQKKIFLKRHDVLWKRVGRGNQVCRGTLFLTSPQFLTKYCVLNGGNTALCLVIRHIENSFLRMESNSQPSHLQLDLTTFLCGKKLKSKQKNER